MFDVFSLCSTQWSIGPTGLRMSLRYDAVIAVATACAIPVDREFFEYLQALEAGAIAGMTDQELPGGLYG